MLVVSNVPGSGNERERAEPSVGWGSPWAAWVIIPRTPGEKGEEDA
jgi:hypothetical protein